MKSLANRPLFRQVSITICCIAAGLFVGIFAGELSVQFSYSDEASSDLLPTVCEQLNQDQYELILAQPHSCQDYKYLEDQIQALEVTRKSMQEVKSEIVLEQLNAIDGAIDRLHQTHSTQSELTAPESTEN